MLGALCCGRERQLVLQTDVQLVLEGTLRGGPDSIVPVGMVSVQGTMSVVARLSTPPPIAGIALAGADAAPDKPSPARRDPLVGHACWMAHAAWREIRALRAAPPLLAEGGPRRQVFGAALQQSEELFDAAQAVGPPSKPLPLFYGLSQAGRAIAAAQNMDEATWQIVGHGLSVRGDAHDVRSSRVLPKPAKNGNDAISSVAAALMCPRFEEPVTLAALAGALPELGDRNRVRGQALPAVEITPEAPSQLWDRLVPSARGTIYLYVKDGGDVSGVLAQYANIAGYVHDLPPVALTEMGPTRVLLSWPGKPANTSSADPRTLRSLSDVAEKVRGRWYLRPRLGAEDPGPGRILVWWALLLALSSLARYHPAEWVAALDVDRSTLAVDLEETLRVAEEEVPALIARALGPSGKPPRTFMPEPEHT